MQNHLTDEQYAFIVYLTNLNTEKDRGTLAVLRRGLSTNPTDNLNMYRFVARKIPDSDRGTDREGMYFLMAALYALNPTPMGKGNFGDHMKYVAYQRKDIEAAERRFTVLLNTRMEDLNTPMRQAVMMIKQQQEQPIKINWIGLFADLLRWNHPQKMVQRNWANSFWGYEHPTEEVNLNQSVENH